jgi:hypothetical protein
MEFLYILGIGFIVFYVVCLLLPKNKRTQILYKDGMKIYQEHNGTILCIFRRILYLKQLDRKI